MKFLRTTLAATAAAFLLTASIAAACDGHKSATTASAGGSGKAEATTVSGSGGCAKGKATNASGSACCAKGKAATASGGCAEKAKMAGCCKKGEPVMATVGETDDAAACKFKAGTVAFKGTVLCNHCDLKKAETCQTMFRTESGCLFAMSGDKAKELREAAVGGSKLVRIKGEVSSTGELSVTSYRVIRSLDSGASAM